MDWRKSPEKSMKYAILAKTYEAYIECFLKNKSPEIERNLFDPKKLSFPVLFPFKCTSVSCDKRRIGYQYAHNL